MGCRVCRARKVKCDGRTQLGCRNCERLQLECVLDDGTTFPHKTNSAASDSSEAGPSTGRWAGMTFRKVRTYRSCAACRQSKTKCDGDRPKCSRCITKRLNCEYDGESAPRWAKNLGHDPPAVAKSEPGSAIDSSSSLTINEGEARRVASEDLEPRQGPAHKVATVLGSIPQEDSFRSLSLEPSHKRKLSQTATGDGDAPPPESCLWLLSPELPSPNHLQQLADEYFANIHPLRCFAFVHKPTFMRQLDKGFDNDDEVALLYMICAHGAKFLVLDLQRNDTSVTNGFLRAVGNQWARKAEQLLFTTFGKLSVSRLMTALLLHDFHCRKGEFSKALLLSGLCVRMAHALRMSSEYSSDLLVTQESSDPDVPSITSRESCRRLMWACYVMDAWTGCGVDQLTLLRESDIKIQLPCNERGFQLRIASVTETLGVGHVLNVLPPAMVPRRPAANLGIMAYYIRIVNIWKRVVAYLNTLEAKPPPWAPESEFSRLDADLRLWRHNLPEYVQYSPETVYARLDSNQLGTLVLIHCTYHHAFLELYKVSMTDFFRIRKAFSFPQNQAEFLQSTQLECYHHAHEVSKLLAQASGHGTRLLSDSLLPFLLYDSSRVMMCYIAKVMDLSQPGAKTRMQEAIQAIESNNKVSRMIAPLYAVAEPLSDTVSQWLSKITTVLNQPGRGSLDHEQRPEIGDMDLSSSFNTPSIGSESQAYTLPPLSLHRLAQRTDERASASDSRSPTSSAPPPRWDHNSAAQQLANLSQDAQTPSWSRVGLQHEKPVSESRMVPNAPSRTPQSASGSTAVDLDDLNSLLNWDMYGMLEMGNTMVRREE